MGVSLPRELKINVNYGVTVRCFISVITFVTWRGISVCVSENTEKLTDRNLGKSKTIVGLSSRNHLL